MSRKTLTLKTKVSVYKTMVLPILTQDCETLPAKQNQLQKLEGCQYRLLRAICNKKWEDFVSYVELFETLEKHSIQLPSVEILIRKKRLEYLHKILSMDNNRLAKRIAFSDTIQGKRKRGRLPFSWRQAINQDLKVFQLQYITSMMKIPRKKLSKLGLNSPSC